MKARPGPIGSGLRVRPQIDTPTGMLLNAQRVALLEAIGSDGSISSAARRVGLSYKSAWAAVNEMNALAQQTLVCSNSGGSQGGGSTLTGHGRRLIAMYRVLESESCEGLAQMEALDDFGSAPDLDGLRRALRSRVEPGRTA